MSGSTVATMRWRALDREGRDTCRLVRHDAGWMLIGHARFRESEGESALDYVVRCDPDWRTRSADVSGTWRDRPVALRALRQGERWRLNGATAEAVEGATDIAFGFTPATNLMPIRRLPEIGGIDCTAAWLRDPGEGLVPLGQRYIRRRGGVVHYRAESGAESDLLVASCGFVTRYPGHWEVEDGA
ncbi:putative glycolipid-binding domain-containing protein [Roseivivax sp. CAU 1761]